jgi:hypothetical protein
MVGELISPVGGIRGQQSEAIPDQYSLMIPALLRLGLDVVE